MTFQVRCSWVRSRRGLFPAKIDLLYFINREPLFLCLKHIQAQLLGSKVAFRVHETLVWNTEPDLPDPDYPPEVT